MKIERNWWAWCPLARSRLKYARFNLAKSVFRLGDDPYSTGHRIVPGCPTVDLLIEALPCQTF
jgi:hypothetical protein